MKARVQVDKKYIVGQDPTPPSQFCRWGPHRMPHFPILDRKMRSDTVENSELSNPRWPPAM